MDQAPKSTDQKLTDHNNNSNINHSSSSTPTSACSCTNISIMQLFHEMKQEFPKVPDHTVQQHVTDNCHNRRACIDQLRQATTVTSPTATMYPSKSIHSNQQTPRSPVNGVKWANNQKMKEISEMFENSSSDASSSSDGRLKRPTTLKLRRAPDPPSSTASSSASTPNSTTNLSKLTSAASSTSSIAASTTSVSSISSSNQPTPAEQFLNQQFHHNVTLDSSASKYNDSLNVQLNLTVSPMTSSAPPIPPKPTRPARHTSQLSVKPEPAFTSMMDPRRTAVGETSASSGTTGQRSYTSVNFTLRQPALILPSPQTPIDIQAGPSSLTYSSSSFDAKQGYQSHLKITVAGNGESCIQAVRTKQPAGNALPEISQIDTTINIGGKGTTCSEPIRITTKPHNQQKLPPIDRLTDEELRLLIQRQMKQKELLECELHNERKKLEMVRFDIITLTSPMMTRSELQQLCDEISRLRSACERLADEVDVVSAPPRSPAVTSTSRPHPPIPTALRCLSLHQSPFHTQPTPLDTSRLNFPQTQPPSYNDVMRESGRTPVTASMPNLANNENDDVNEGEWSCSMCTFLNYPLLNQCEQCDMPRVQGIKITSSSYRPLRQNNPMQRASESVATNHDNNNVAQATAL